MTPDEIKYRRCSVPGCNYKELRGSKQGAFRDGKFICDTCYTEMPEPRHEGEDLCPPQEP